MIRSTLVAFALAWLNCLALGQPPEAQGPTRWKETQKSFIEFERLTLSQAYKSVGTHNTRWDEQAIEFLNAAADQSAGSSSEDQLELAMMGQGLMDSGCTDPLVKSYYAIVIDPEGHPPGALPFLQKGADAMEGSKYSAIRKAVAWFRLGASIAANRTPTEARTAYSKGIDHFVRAVSSPEEPRMPLRLALMKIRPRINREFSEDQVAMLFQKLEAAKADSWLIDMCRGEVCDKAAWAARGEGFANTVTDEAWKAFHSNMEKARKYYEAAHARHPEFPDAAKNLMSAARCGHVAEGLSLQTWFDRATEAEFDFPYAYKEMLWALRPRWSGSYDKMIAFGKKCAATKKYDTEVPYQFIQALLDVADDSQDFSTVFKRPGVVATAKEVLRGYAIAAPEHKRYNLSLLTAIAWRAGKADEAAAIFEELTDGFDSDAAQTVRAWDFEVVDDLCTHSGQFKERYAEAAAAHAAKDYTNARKLYEAIEKECPRNEVIRWRVAGDRVANARFIERFESGKETELTFDELTHGWTALSGGFVRVNERTLKMYAGTGGITYLMQAPVGRRFQLSGTIDFTGVTDPSAISAGIGFGLEYGSSDHARWFGASVFPGSNTAAVTLGWPRKGDLKAPAFDGPVSFECTCFDESFSLRINGTRVYRGTLPKHPDWTPGDGLALGGEATKNFGSVQFSNLKIKKLSEDPEAEGGKPKF